MDLTLVFSGRATLEDMYQLEKLGYTFDINDGEVKGAYKN